MAEKKAQLMLVINRRRVIYDSREPTSEEEEKRRSEHTFAEIFPGRRLGLPQGWPPTIAALKQQRDARVAAGLPEYEMPERPELFHEGDERKLRAKDAALDAECTAIQAELLGRHPGAFSDDDGILIYDFLGEPELRARWGRALDEAEARAAALQPLPVKPGDFVRVGGRVLRISAIDQRRRTVATERLDAEGRVVSSVPGCKADGLVPLPEPADPAAGDWPSFPDHLRDGLARARFVLRVHEVLLEEAGLVDPD